MTSPDPSNPPLSLQPQDSIRRSGEALRILALEPYRDGSHAAFLDGWIGRSRHRWTVLSLPGHHWKWRMRHAAATFADEVAERPADRWDVLFSTSMLNLAEFRGLARPEVGLLPAVIYFHENQLTYPVRHEDRRDLHFAVSHIMTLKAADAVWFNSRFHRDSFAEALAGFVRRMPDDSLRTGERLVEEKGSVQPPGVDTHFHRLPRKPGPLRILWAARWEFDKNPEGFFQALEKLDGRGVDFRLSVLGQCYSDVPAIFETARARFADRIDHWGYEPTREGYRAVLAEADVVVSTADHEFFGISMVEAMAAGAYPLLPKRLSYPELLEPLGNAGTKSFFYDIGKEAESPEVPLAAALRLSVGRSAGRERFGRRAFHGLPTRCQRFDWSNRAAAMDVAVESLARRRRFPD